MTTCELLKQYGTWRDVADLCRTTAGMDAGTGEPSYDWKYRMLKSEHSPIRVISFRWIWRDMPYWVSTHFVRHKIGIEHFVRSQRGDELRGSLPQDAPVDHECVANVQAIISISRKRLCLKAAPETYAAWAMLVERLPTVVYNVCLPDCQYRGGCYEIKPCSKGKDDKN